MANIIDETENGVILVVGLAVFVALFWIAGGIDFFKGLLKGGSDAAGTKQSLTNALSGFPNGADPGTIPAFQYLQGIVESFRNAGDYVFGSNPNQRDPGSATAQEQSALLESYTPLAADQAQQFVTTAPGQWQNWLNGVQSNPANLPMF